jgi:hypothetical protein
MHTTIPSVLLLRTLIQPGIAFAELARTEPSPIGILLRYTVWLLLLPPVFSWVGGYSFGWRLGADQPLMLDPATLTRISIAYFSLLLFGLVSTAFISRWMASTYGANTSPGLHIALITIVGAPLALASIAHIFPDVFFNVIVLIPVMIWSMYLLYTGLPVLLSIPPERGMLMASALVGWLLVAAVSLLGLTMGLWTTGIGPVLGV